MQISSTFKTIFAAGIAMLIISCSDSKEKVKVQEITLQDVKQEEKDIEPPPPPPPQVEIPSGAKKCYANDGLKYKTIITIVFGDKNTVTGNVTSEELESGKKENAAFEGTMEGIKFMVKFKGAPPVMGAASEWTDKPWTIEQLEGKGEWMERLHITFNAKNYDTNKWADTDYQFAQVACK
jgi:hypothetical protein